ncbi:unnamed protein product [Lota lota]
MEAPGIRRPVNLTRLFFAIPIADKLCFKDNGKRMWISKWELQYGPPGPVEDWEGVVVQPTGLTKASYSGNTEKQMTRSRVYH